MLYLDIQVIFHIKYTKIMYHYNNLNKLVKYLDMLVMFLQLNHKIYTPIHLVKLLQMSHNKHLQKVKILILNINMSQHNNKSIFNHLKCFKEQQQILQVLLIKKLQSNPLNTQIILEHKLINLLSLKLNHSDKNQHNKKINNLEIQRLLMQMENSMLNYKNQFLDIQDLEEELWQIIYLEKHLLNVLNNLETIQKIYCIKKIEISILNQTYNLHLNFDQQYVLTFYFHFQSSFLFINKREILNKQISIYKLKKLIILSILKLIDLKNDVPSQKKSLFSIKQKNQRSCQSDEYQQQIYRKRWNSSLAPKKQLSMPKPHNSGIFHVQKKLISEPTLFKKYYDRGDLPVAVSFVGALRKLTWKMEPQHLDYHLHLPIFFQGLRQTQQPYKFLANTGTDQLIQRNPNKLLPVLPQLIIPIKKALSTKDAQIMCTTLKKIQKLVLAGQMIGQALVPYYRQILPVFNMFRSKRLNIGDKIDYAQRKNQNLADLIQQTLQILEKHGGQDAYINIKYMIPTYQSCMF